MDAFSEKVRREEEQPARTRSDDGGIIPDPAEQGGPFRPDAPLETLDQPEFAELSE